MASLVADSDDDDVLSCVSLVIDRACLVLRMTLWKCLEVQLDRMCADG